MVVDVPFEVIETGMHFEDCKIQFNYFMDAPYSLDYCQLIKDRMQVVPQGSEPEPGVQA